MTQAAIPNLDRQICPTCSAIYGSAYDLCPTDGTVLIPGAGDELLGTTLAQKYVIDECIGEGGMGRVYRAHHVRLKKRTFAIKILLGDLAADPTMRKRFEQEAESASRLQHPNVVSVLDFGKTDGGLLYLVMEFVAGNSLSDVMKSGPMPEARVIAIAQKLCLGLAHAHNETLVHRDFKPDNVVLADRDDSDMPRILDFGLAIVRSPEEASIRLTGSGLMVGTPAYISPEQARGGRVDQRTDLFSLGISIYEMLAGKLPFTGDAIEIMYANTKLDAPSIAERNPDVSVSLEMQAVVRKLMARDPEKRFQTAREVLTVLRAIAGNGSEDTTEADESLANLLASQDELLGPDAKVTVPSGVVGGIKPKIVLDVPVVAGPVRSKTRIVSVAVAAVLLLALGVFALLRFGGSTRAGDDQVADPAEVMLVVPLDESEVKPAITPDTDAGSGKDVAPVTEPQDSEEEDLDAKDIKSPRDQGRPPKEDMADKNQQRREQRRKADREQKARSDKALPSDPETEPGSKTPVVTTDVSDAKDPEPAVENSDNPPLPPPKDKPELVVTPPKVTPPPPPAVPKVFDAITTIQAFSVQGSLSSRIVRRAIDRALPALRQCYKDASQRAKKNLGGTVTASLEINEQGRASKVKVGSYALPGLSQCLSKGFTSVRTRVSPDVGTVRVALTLNFAAKK